METKNDKYNSENKNNSKEIATQFSSIEKLNPFQVPDKYFEDLPSVIQEKAAQTEVSVFSSMFKWVSGHPKYSISLGMATISIVLLIVFISQPQNKSSVSFADITIEDILIESPEFIYYMDESEIIDVMIALSDIDLNSFYLPDLETDNDITEEDLIDYLDNENFETNILYNL